MTYGAPAASRLNPLRWLGVPLVVCVIATVLFAAPIRLFGLMIPQPVFAMVPAFAWGVIRPSMLAPFLLLLLGLFLDAFGGGPTGLWAIALVSAYGLVLGIRRTLTGRGMAVIWVWYGAACLLAFGVGMLVTLVKTGSVPSPLALIWSFLITLLLYPFAHRLIERFEDADVRFR